MSAISASVMARVMSRSLAPGRMAASALTRGPRGFGLTGKLQCPKHRAW
ncbi:hypothetical protein [Stappia stellulata]|nr:hypothetical protein [Stappia stellulata]